MAACPATEPLWIKPPADSAVSGSPEFGLYFANPDRSILASAGWTDDPESRRASDEGIKIGWFRPKGAELEITGRRLDGEAPPLQTHLPCCYPTRFQASGVYFPTEGCWEVTARAIPAAEGSLNEVYAEGSSAIPLLSFVVWIDPE